MGLHQDVHHLVRALHGTQPTGHHMTQELYKPFYREDGWYFYMQEGPDEQPILVGIFMTEADTWIAIGQFKRKLIRAIGRKRR
jgi:hypothetical protein